jgi:hypothetical protein
MARKIIFAHWEYLTFQFKLNKRLRITNLSKKKYSFALILFSIFRLHQTITNDEKATPRPFIFAGRNCRAGADLAHF